METINCDDKRMQPKNAKRIAIGLVVILVGVLLMFKNLNLISEYWVNIIFTWKMLFVGVGFVNIFGRKPLFGVLMMSIGGFLVLNDVVKLTASFDFSILFWPLILIFSGLTILSHNRGKRKCNPHRVYKSSGTDEYIEDVAIFGGSERNITSEAFKGGNVTAVFGGSSFNFTNSKLAEGKNEIEVALIFGGSKMVIPSDWNVKIEVVSVFGAFVDKRIINRLNPDNTRLLVIKGVAVFGGGEIKTI